MAASAPPAAAATDISLESRTFIPARGTDGESTHALVYEYLSLDARGLLQPGLYLRVGGWGRVDLADETYGRKSNGELQYAYLGWRAPVLNAEVRAGRLSVTSGVARHEVVDGLLFGSDLPAGFDVTLYGGIPTEVGEESRSKDLLYGARVSQGRAGLYRIGASYLKEENGGDVAREEAGADLFFAPHRLVELTGTSLYNLADEAWARHEYRLVLGPFAKTVRLTASWAATDYAAYFKEPMNRALIPIEDDEHDRIGGEIEFFFGPSFTLALEYFGVHEPKEGEHDGDMYGARLDWSGSTTAAGAGYRLVRGESIDHRYQEISAHASRSFGALRVALGAEYVKYEEKINGENYGTSGTLGVSYAASGSLELSASAGYGQTPEYDREIKGLLAVLWRYDASMKKGGTK
jgi:hypothetical protein